MITEIFKKKAWPHILLWAVMLTYFFFAPSLFVSFIAKNGKPLQSDTFLPKESNAILFRVDGLEPFVKDGENLYNLFGWALIIPQSNESTNSYLREIVLASDEQTYFFSVKSKYRNPEILKQFTDTGIDLDTLGFGALIAEDAIKPGKYRIGVLYRNLSTDSGLYSDKPAHYLIKTPNSLSLEKK